MRDSPLETTVERAVGAYSRKHGWRDHKWKRPGQRGALDRFYTKYPRRILFIEYKQDGEQPEPVQALEIDRLQQEGFEVFVVDNVEEGKAIFDSR